MNELKKKLDEENKEYLVATIMDLHNMIEHQRRQMIIKDRAVKMFQEVNAIHETSNEDIRYAILNILKNMATDKYDRYMVMDHLERLRDIL